MVRTERATGAEPHRAGNCADPRTSSSTSCDGVHFCSRFLMSNALLHLLNWMSHIGLRPGIEATWMPKIREASSGTFTPPGLSGSPVDAISQCWLPPTSAGGPSSGLKRCDVRPSGSGPGEEAVGMSIGRPCRRHLSVLGVPHRGFGGLLELRAWLLSVPAHPSIPGRHRDHSGGGTRGANDAYRVSSLGGFVVAGCRF
jgi:hypothetical protein